MTTNPNTLPKPNHHTQLNPFASLLDAILFKACELGVSDIHFTPSLKAGGQVRFRLYGVLSVAHELSLQIHWDDLLKEVKRRAGLSFQKGIAQDARFSDAKARVDLRANLIPVQKGTRLDEQIVLRLLPWDVNFSLEKLGLSKTAFAHLTHAASLEKGLFLVTGPTGSGKTRTLLSILQSLDRERYSVLSLEDPVEQPMEGISQVEISKHLSFAQGLRAFLRQDPDYILVGETRDHETAENLLHAANTGHLVFTTLHTNSAIEAVERLVSLGAQKDLLQELLVFVCAQRLLPLLCKHCKQDDEDSLKILEHFFDDLPEEFIPKKSMGCAECQGTGIKGRALLFEYLTPEKNKDGKKFLKEHTTLLEEAKKHLLKGDCDAKEILSLL
jgi:type II secretory ATPase GspE/PulE/Tfp pilus assembly ATPase PilB-like protein